MRSPSAEISERDVAPTPCEAARVAGDRRQLSMHEAPNLASRCRWPCRSETKGYNRALTLRHPQTKTLRQVFMAIYGTALLSVCLLVGLIAGKLLGSLIGVQANVGGVGIAMLLLIVVSDQLHRRGLLRPPTEAGILFWSSVYIPIVVAMAASQNVRGAITGGPVAIVAGSLAVLACFALVPAISRLGR